MIAIFILAFILTVYRHREYFLRLSFGITGDNISNGFYGVPMRSTYYCGHRKNCVN